MDTPIFKTAVDSLFKTLVHHGYDKEAAELQELYSAAVAPPPVQKTPSIKLPTSGGRFEEERHQPTSNPKVPEYKGQSGSVAPILQLSRIVDKIEANPSFKNLPQEVAQGILKVKKMTSNAFRYASEKDALFGSPKNPVKELQSLLSKFDNNTSAKEMPVEVIKALHNLSDIVTQHVDSLPKEKGIFEKGMDVARGVADKGKNVAQGIAEKGKDFAQGVAEKGKEFAQGIAEKGHQVRQNIQENKKRKINEQRVTTERQQSALKALKKGLFDYPGYKEIFYRLPAQITKVLEGIGLGVEDLNNLATAKVACHVNNALLHYLRTKEAYSSGKETKVTKEAMDFSGIGNLITLEGKLDDRELSRTIRLAIAAELDAIHLYELIVDSSNDEKVKKVLQDISDEEKVHVGELQELLSKLDKDSDKFLEEGRKEVQDSK
jgi:hypothetical protein